MRVKKTLERDTGYPSTVATLPVSPLLDVEEDDWEELLEAEEETISKSHGYVSPLMSKMESTRLTVAMLNIEIPVVRDGEEAKEKLEKATKRLGEKSRSELVVKVKLGDEAKERLFAAALPLIRTVAAREWRRRQQWGSQVPLEDLTQETIIGFLKGIAGFRTEAIGRSATNYLGQWMLVETRRQAEVLDHDLQVGHDAGERFRRVRALRTRLAAEYGREPTDEEISEASRNPDYVTRPGMVGKAPKEGEERLGGRGITVSQIEEERVLRSRVGRMARFSHADDTDESSTGPGLVDPNRETIVDSELSTNIYSSPEDQIVNEDASKIVSAVLTAAMDRLGLPPAQREIISRRYGLAGYDEMSAREIARVMKMQRDRVSRVLTAFQQEMTRPGGSFHAVIRNMNYNDLRAVGLDWAVDTLGEWPAGPATPPPNILIDSVSFVKKAPVLGEEKSKATGVFAWFHCDYHDRTFSGLYPTRAQVPRKRPCPSCQRPSERIKIAEA